MTRLRWIAVTAVLLSVTAFLWATASLPALPSETQAAAVIARAHHPVASYSATLVDASRPTPKHGDYAGAESRTLALTVWHPREALGPQPLVVYSHGFGGHREDASYLCEQLAALGYVVVAPDFPATNMRAPSGAYLPDVLNQPGDQRFIIDQVLKWNDEAGHPLHGRVDAQRIGAMGVSLGGLTTTLLAFDPERSDPRVKAAVSIVGLHAMLGPQFYRHRVVPYLEVAAEDDAVVPYANHGARVPRDVPGAILVSIARGSHSGAVSLFRYLRFFHHPDRFVCWLVEQQLRRSGTATTMNGPAVDWSSLGSAEVGVNVSTERDACLAPPMGEALDPREQQRITSVSVLAFFEAQFASDADVRTTLSGYLRRGLAEELPHTGVAFGPRDD